MKQALLLLGVILSCTNVVGQTITWSAPVSVAPSSNGNMHPRIALNGSQDPVVIWGSTSMGGQAKFARWNGTSFATPVTLNPMTLPVFAATWAGPDIATYGDTIYAVFKNTPEDTGKMYLARSYDGGQNWQPLTSVGMGMDTSRFPTLATDASGNPMVGYMQFKQNYADPHYVLTKSANYGNSFGMPVSASNEATEACDCCPAAVVTSGSTVSMLFRDNDANIRTIWARTSSDGGNTFPDSTEIDNTNWMIMSCPSSGPDGVIIGDTLYSVFRSSPSGNRVFFSRSSLATPQLVSCTQFAANFTGLNNQDFPRIAAAGNDAAIVWRQVVGSSSRLSFSFTGDVNAGFPTAYDTLASAGVANADVALAPGEIHVVWEDNLSGTVMYRKGTYPLAINEVTKNATTIELYPNPASSYFSVSLSSVNDVATCMLIDNNGRKVPLKVFPVGNGFRFPLTNVAAGIYTVHITDGAGKTFTSSLIVK